jgi:hypothetical protein
LNAAQGSVQYPSLPQTVVQQFSAVAAVQLTPGPEQHVCEVPLHDPEQHSSSLRQELAVAVHAAPVVAPVVDPLVVPLVVVPVLLLPIPQICVELVRTWQSVDSRHAN